SSPLLLLKKEDLYAVVADRLRPMLLQSLEEAQRGQRLRVTTLPESVMDALCEGLQGDPRWVARVLAANAHAVPWRATATKLIELRNALEQPLLVFIPPGLRTAAADSLDIATFTELPLTTLAQSLAAELVDRIPESLRTDVASVLTHLREQRHVRNADEEVEFLATVLKNGASAAAAGGALCALRLIPDFALFTRGNILYWLSRNLNACETLSDGQPLQAAILRLPIKPGTVQSRLFAFLRTRQRGDLRSWTSEIASRPEFLS